MKFSLLKLKNVLKVLSIGFISFQSVVFAQDFDRGIIEGEGMKLLYNVTHQLEVALNENTVLCSRADYAGEFLKVLIPQLADITLLDHQNSGAGAPCLGAGTCRSRWSPTGPLPSDIINPEKPTEKINITVKVFRQTYKTVDQSGKEGCEVQIVEELKSNIRGINFYHLRDKFLGERSISDCK